MLNMKQSKKHKKTVEERGYIYLFTYEIGEYTIDKHKLIKDTRIPYMRIICPYCKTEYDVRCSGFINENQQCTHCCHEYEKSFAYYIEEELGLDLNDIWDWEENGRRNINPWDITNTNDKKVWIWCQDKWYHGSYPITIAHFKEGNRCGYCKNKKIHKWDSFGYLYPEKAKYWSKNNDKSPFEVAPKTNDKYKFICQECGEEFDRALGNMNRYDNGVVCKECNSSQGETKIIRWLDKNNIEYIHNKPYFNDLLSNLGYPLKPDFILSNKKIWIEYDGKQHFEWI